MSVRLIALFGFDGVQLLDVTGPASVFGLANTLGPREAYKIVLVSPRGGLVERVAASSCRRLRSRCSSPARFILCWSGAVISRP
jgi:transcriptional regulator GlxA family with amidase domain